MQQPCILTELSVLSFSTSKRPMGELLFSVNCHTLQRLLSFYYDYLGLLCEHTRSQTLRSSSSSTLRDLVTNIVVNKAILVWSLQPFFFCLNQKSRCIWKRFLTWWQDVYFDMFFFRILVFFNVIYSFFRPLKY